ncbi:50S ribosomal protein L33 [Bacillaceae bacterium W0354]
MRRKIALACTVCRSRNYTTIKNSQEENRIEIKKYCKKCQDHTLHRETK